MQSFKLRTDVTIGALIHIGVLSTEAEPLSGRSDVESRWMTRWVLGRRVDEWSKLVGFAGEYLVATTPRELMSRCTAYSSFFFPIFRPQIGPVQ